MKAAARLSARLLLAGLAIGTLSDFAIRHDPVYLGGYQVLICDFHLHSFPLSASTLTPWDLMWDAQHEGLDAVAITGQNEVWSGRIAAWVARHLGGPTVLAGEEIHGPAYHMIAAGIHSTISWRLSPADAIAEIHRQGGVAIAAHPSAYAWPAYDARAVATLDGSEVWHPASFDRGAAGEQFQAFFARTPMAAIASSDWHGPGPPGLGRTWVFARRNTAEDILQAIRERRTVVYDGSRYFGDPALVELARAEPRLRRVSRPAAWAATSRVCAFLGLLGILAGWRRW